MLSTAATPSSSDLTGDVLKVVQIFFYVIAAIVAVLTYRAAKKGWLAPVNTEYQKRVMERLAKLSEDLYSEFDPNSEHYWPKIKPVHGAIDHMNGVFERYKAEILATKAWGYGSPQTEDVRRMEQLLRPVVSDPFIPESIREAVVDFLENRIAVLSNIYIDEFETYGDGLATGTQQPLTELNEANAIHNRVVDAQHAQGCGISAIENEIHDLRGLIQSYFDGFNPKGRKTIRPRRNKPDPSSPSGAHSRLRVGEVMTATDETAAIRDDESEGDPPGPEELDRTR
jgi:hypothetical protein